MKIEGEFLYIVRDKVPCPDDGVHRVGKDGIIKGVHSLMVGNRVVPKGQVGYYWRMNEDTGMKVFFSFGFLKAQKPKYVKRQFDKMRKAYKIRVCVKPIVITMVHQDIVYKKKRYKMSVPAIVEKHVHYPDAAWAEYAKGHPYDWDCLDQKEHPEHNPKGYHKFVDFAKKTMKEHHVKTDTSYKVGDVVYCTKTKRWYLVDIGE